MGISIRTLRLGFNPGQFQVWQDGSGGYIIDRATIVPQINQTLFGERNTYDEVMALFREYHDTINFERETNPPYEFQLCYEHRPGFNDFVTITYHFGDADYPVDSQSTHFPGDLSRGYFCIAIMPDGGINKLCAHHP